MVKQILRLTLFIIFFTGIILSSNFPCYGQNQITVNFQADFSYGLEKGYYVKEAWVNNVSSNSPGDCSNSRISPSLVTPYGSVKVSGDVNGNIAGDYQWNVTLVDYSDNKYSSSGYFAIDGEHDEYTITFHTTEIDPFDYVSVGKSGISYSGNNSTSQGSTSYIDPIDAIKYATNNFINMLEKKAAEQDENNRREYIENQLNVAIYNWNQYKSALEAKDYDKILEGNGAFYFDSDYFNRLLLEGIDNYNNDLESSSSVMNIYNQTEMAYLTAIAYSQKNMAKEAGYYLYYAKKGDIFSQKLYDRGVFTEYATDRKAKNFEAIINESPYFEKIRSNNLFTIYYNSIEANLNGQKYTSDFPAFNDNGVFMIPLQSLLKKTETSINQDEETKNLIFIKEGENGKDEKVVSSQDGVYILEGTLFGTIGFLKDYLKINATYDEDSNTLSMYGQVKANNGVLSFEKTIPASPEIKGYTDVIKISGHMEKAIDNNESWVREFRDVIKFNFDFYLREPINYDLFSQNSNLEICHYIDLSFPGWLIKVYAESNDGHSFSYSNISSKKNIEDSMTSSGSDHINGYYDNNHVHIEGYFHTLLSDDTMLDINELSQIKSFIYSFTNSDQYYGNDVIIPIE